MKHLLTALSLVLVLAPAAARADVDDWTEVDAFEPSPEHFGVELRVGSYNPLDLGDGWSRVFGSDLGPYLGLELHYFPVRIDYLGLIGGGFGIGWAQYAGVARRADSTATTQGETNTFEIVPLNLNLVWRFDTLARELNVPVVLTPKIGLDVVYWGTGVGGRGEADGWAIGPRFAGKVSLELDFLEPRAARQLDEEWGVNHSEVFFELWYSMAGDLIDSQLPVSGWGWVAGLGFTF